MMMMIMIMMTMMMMMMMMMKCFCGMVDWQKAFSLISDKLQAEFEPGQNLSSDLVE